MILRALVAAVLLFAPFAAAEVPPVARCNSVYCFSLYDEDGDGTPDGIAGGTASVVHDAPTLQFGHSATGTWLFGDIVLGEEDALALFLVPYVGADHADGAVSAAYVGLTAASFDAETGERSHAEAALVLSDTDGDGRADTAAPLLILP